MKKWLTGAACALALALTVLAVPLRADSGPAFMVTPVYPENQRQQNGYLDIRVEPGQRQDLVLRVENHASTPMEVEVAVVNASTAPGGFIDYATPDIRDETLGHPFVDMVEVPYPVVAVPAGGERNIVLALQVPDEAIDGMILGGIRVRKRSAEQGAGMINNEYQYALACVITMNDQEVLPDFELLDVTSGLENYRAAVTATLRNFEAAPAKNVQVQAALHTAGQSEPFYTMEKTIDVAPNSVWNCTLLDQEGYGYPAGSYLFRMRMELDERVWEFEREFAITGTEAANINGNAVNQQQAVTAGAPVWLYLVCTLGAILLVILLLLLVVLLRRRRAD